jgi:hypothetical protein
VRHTQVRYLVTLLASSERGTCGRIVAGTGSQGSISGRRRVRSVRRVRGARRCRFVEDEDLDVTPPTEYPCMPAAEFRLCSEPVAPETHVTVTAIDCRSVRLQQCACGQPARKRSRIRRPLEGERIGPSAIGYTDQMDTKKARCGIVRPPDRRAGFNEGTRTDYRHFHHSRTSRAAFEMRLSSPSLGAAARFDSTVRRTTTLRNQSTPRSAAKISRG